jgi:putative DNA primase/helicase
MWSASDRVSYSPFAAFCVLFHGSDCDEAYRAGAKELARRGYRSVAPGGAARARGAWEESGSEGGEHSDSPSGGRQADAERPSNMPAADCTDLWNAEHLVRLHGGDLRFCHAWESWLVWDDRRWKVDSNGETDRRAKATMKCVRADAANRVGELARNLEGASEDERPTVEQALKRATRQMTWAAKSQNAGRISALMTLARSEPGIPIGVDDMDPNPWLFNVPNGTLDLREGKLRPHDRSDAITQLSPVEYDEQARAPTFEKFLNVVFPDPNDPTGTTGNISVIAYIQRLLGYCLTGDVSEHILPILHGPGGNGKGTLLEVLMHLMGDYASPTAPDLIVQTKGERHPTEIADLYRKRAVVASEADKGVRLNESLVKRLSGGDRLKARRMNEDFWWFDPTHKVLLLTNHLPRLTHVGEAWRRRIHLVPFSVSFWDAARPVRDNEVRLPCRQKDRRMAAKLKGEAPGILAWLVRGSVMWAKEGFQMPEAVTEATDSYFSQQDVWGRFVSERCLVGKKEYKVRKRDLYAAYKHWSDEAGERKLLTEMELGDEVLKIQGVEKYINNGTCYRGIQLNTDN